MRTSESQSALIEALLAAQAKFPSIDKTKEGQSGNRKFKYAPLDVVLNAVRPVLLENRLLLTQCVEGDSIITRLDHASGEWRESSMPVNHDHANMQSYGIELTYRRRYALQPMLGIVTEEDTDGSGAQKRKGKDHTDPRNENGTLGAGGSISAPDEFFNALSPEWQAFLKTNLGPRVENAFEGGGPSAALDVINAEEIDSDTMAALWHVLPSKVRSAIDKVTKNRPRDEAWQAAH